MSNEVPTYLDIHSDRIILVEERAPLSEVLLHIPSDFRPFPEEVVSVKGARYNLIKINPNTDEKDIKDTCKLIRREIAVTSLFLSYRDVTDHVKIGFVVCNPISKKPSFVLIGIYDKKSDIYFPKLKVYSKNPVRPLFGPTALPLPTTAERLNQSIRENSIAIFNTTEIPKDVKRVLITRLIYASFIYGALFIFENGEEIFPPSIYRSISIPENSFNVFETYLPEGYYDSTLEEKEIPMKRPPLKISIHSDADKEKYIKKFNDAYPYLDEYALDDWRRYIELISKYFVSPSKDTFDLVIGGIVALMRAFDGVADDINISVVNNRVIMTFEFKNTEK